MSEQDIRLTIIREICQREGHGDIVEIGTVADLPFSVGMCRRGCGAEVVVPSANVTPSLLVSYLERKYAGREAFFRRDGRIEVRP